jgi:energy-coupling factor transporter ATP-binding protein EcfA2
MALNFDEVGDPIGIVSGGPRHDQTISVARNDENVKGYKKIGGSSGGMMIPVVNPNRQSISYITGPNGSGKSTYARMLAESFREYFPKNKIFIFCRTKVENDPAYESLDARQIVMDESLVENPLDIETDVARGSLIIFDDTSSIHDKKIKDAIMAFQIDLMECGRKLDLYVIFTNHLANPSERNLGRVVLNEASSFTFFPKSGAIHQVKYCLKNYFGLDNRQIKEMMELDSRWVTVFKNYPMVVMHQRGAYQL